MSKQVKIKKRDLLFLTNPKEVSSICIPTKLINTKYKEGATKLMLHIFLYNYGRGIKELYFSTTAFLNWSEKKERIRSYKKREVEEIIKDWEEIGLITVLENITTDVFKIRLEENFYSYGIEKYYKNFVTVYADEVEKILNLKDDKKNNVNSKMILFVFLYLKQYKNSRNGMFLSWIADEIFSKTKTDKVRMILELLEKEEMIYYKKATLTKNKDDNFAYTRFQYIFCYERDLKNKVEYYGEEFIKQKLKELGKEDDYE